MRSWHLHPFYPDVAIGQWCDRFIMLLKRVTRFFFSPFQTPTVLACSAYVQNTIRKTRAIRVVFWYEENFQ